MATTPIAAPARTLSAENRMDWFYQSVPARPSNGYEEDYWGTVTDPDGAVRDRTQERERHLQNVAEELEFVSSLPAGRILDLGCGLGHFLSALPNGWQKHGVEVSVFAAGHASRWGSIFNGMLEDASYADASFDVVYMHHVIEHLPNPEQTMQHVWRILKPGGHLVLGTPDFDSACARRFGENYRLLHDPTHISLFTNDSMHRFLRAQGWVIDRVSYPYFETPYFNHENLDRLFDTSRISPAFYGSFMTFYCRKPATEGCYEGLLELSRVAAVMAERSGAAVQRACDMAVETLAQGHKILACGNGGSAADAQHFVAELIGRMTCERGSLPALALTTDTSILTAIGNDYGYEEVFSRQVDGLGAPGDLLICMTTSGKSPNVFRALEMARERGMRSVVLTGSASNPRLDQADVVICVPNPKTQRIQEIHTAILHGMCEQVDRYFEPKFKERNA